MAYDPTSRSISAPVSIYDVQRALGISKKDLGELCQAQSINQWSKMKPVEFPYIEPDRTRAVSAYDKTLWWWKGKPGFVEVPAGLVIGNYTCVGKCVWITCCGVKYLGFENRIDVLKAFDPTGNPYHTGDNSPLKDNFSYVPPSGGANSPFRLVDFNNYSGQMPYCILPDYTTETGTVLVNPTDPQSNHVKCGIDLYDATDQGVSPLSFDDLFASVGTSEGFTVVLGEYDSTDVWVASGISVTPTDTSRLHKEVTIDFSSALNNTNYIGIYCARISVNATSYFVPVMQSANDRPNTLPIYAPKRRCFKSWHIETTTPYYPVSFNIKVNYGVSFPWIANPFTSLPALGGSMNRLYMKINAPRKSNGYVVTPQNITLEMDGQFYDPQRGMQMTYYVLTSSDTRFVVKNNEVEAADWGQSDTYNGQPGIYIEPGEGTQTFYLAIYNLFQDIHSQHMTSGGTVWRIRLGISSTEDLDVEYGSLGDDHLNITVSPLNS